MTTIAERLTQLVRTKLGEIEQNNRIDRIVVDHNAWQEMLIAFRNQSPITSWSGQMMLGIPVQVEATPAEAKCRAIEHWFGRQCVLLISQEASEFKGELYRRTSLDVGKYQIVKRAGSAPEFLSYRP